MAPKRAAETVGRGRPKKSRNVSLVPVVADALSTAEALPADLRAVFEFSLPLVLKANKADRHAYEAEIVAEAEKSLTIVQAALEKNHAEALEKQETVISPDEHARRSTAKREAQEGLEAAKSKLESKKEAHAEAKKAVHDANSVVKAADKDAGKLEKEMQALADKKTALSEILTNEFVLLKDGTSQSPAGKKAIKKLESVGKEYHLDDTLLQTLPLTCKKEPANRTEFESLLFDSLKTAMDKQIDTITHKLTELEPAKAEKAAAVATAKEALSRAEAALSGVNEEFTTAQAAAKDAQKEVKAADDFLYKIWGDMKVACDAQDELAAKVKQFKDDVWTAFQQLKEKQPVEEHVEDGANEAGEDAAAEEMEEEEAPQADATEAAASAREGEVANAEVVAQDDNEIDAD